MKTDVEKMENNRVLLKVEVETEEFTQAINQVYRRLVKSVNVPGFRPGRAPRPVLERHVGKKRLLDEAVEILVNDAYHKAVEETGIEPVSAPELELVQTEEGKPVKFNAKVMVKPEVQLGQYTDFEIIKPFFKVRDEDVDLELELLRKNHAQLVTLDEGKVLPEDEVTIDFEGKVGGEPVKEWQANDFTLETGRDELLPGFDDQLYGMSCGETKEIKISLPEDYHKNELASQEMVFTVKLKSLRRKSIPMLDDEFAKDISEFETLAELKDYIRNKLTEKMVNKAEASVRQEIIKKVVDNAILEIPEEMINKQAEFMVQDMEKYIRENVLPKDVSIDEYYKETKSSREKQKEDFYPEAEMFLKTMFVLEAIVKKEGLQIKGEDIDKKLTEIAAQTGQEVSTIREYISKQERFIPFVQDIQREKTIQFLIEKSKIVEEKEDQEERKQEENQEIIQAEINQIEGHEEQEQLKVPVQEEGICQAE
jgi:trigger factor